MRLRVLGPTTRLAAATTGGSVTDETSQPDLSDQQDDGTRDPEIAAIADSLEEPEAEPQAEPEPEPADEPEAKPADEPEAGTDTGEESGAASEAAVVATAEADSQVEDAAEPAPEAVPEMPAEPVVATTAPHDASFDKVSWWPFFVYLALWVVFAGVLIWRFYDMPPGLAIYETPDYALSVFAGIALTLAGPLLMLATWLASWGRPGSSKWGLFVDAFLKGAVVTLGGVAIWWIALVVIDQLRLGRVL